MHLLDGAVTIASRLPRRGLFRFGARYYRQIVTLLVSVIVLASGWAHAPGLTATAVLIYCIYALAPHALPKPWMRLPHPAAYVELVLPLLLIVGTSLFVAPIANSQADGLPRTGDTLWLLYLLPILLISQRGGDTTQVGVVAVCSMLALFFVTPIAPELSVRHHIWMMSIKWLWLALMTLVMHMLIRVIGNRSDDLNELHRLYSQTAAVRSAPEERRLLETVARHLSEVFNSEHANVLEIRANGAIRLLASTASIGSVESGKPFDLPPDWQGIVRHVIDKKSPYYTNDVRKDPHYKRSPSFPQTQSELTVPILIGPRLAGLLDVQSNSRGTFGDDDVSLAVGAAAYVGSLLDNVRLARSYYQVADLFTSIAGRFLSESELVGTLEEIASTANTELEADVVIVYVRDPLTDTVRWGAHAGVLLEPGAIDMTSSRRESIVEQLLAAPEDASFHHKVAETESGVQRPGYRGFVEREGIKSRASLKLVADSGSVGLMFLNYRSERDFDEDSQVRCRVFALAAALAIQKVQTQEQQLIGQREEFERGLHDRIKGTAVGISRLIDNVRADETMAEASRRSLDFAFEALVEISVAADELVSGRQGRPMTDLVYELGLLRRFMEQTYRVAVDVSWPSNPVTLPSTVVRELSFVAREAMGNAARHGASRLSVAASFACDCLTLECCDDGPGFDPGSPTKGHGLINMRTRVKRLDGTFQIETGPKGTQVIATIPVAPVTPEPARLLT